MPRRPIDPFWRERIMAISANEPKLGPGPISRLLRQDAARAHRSDAPSERTVSRVLKEFRSLRDEDRGAYRYFRWPQSMERGDLPWEASGVGLELLRSLHRVNLRGATGEHGRPLISTVKWLWYVTLARPDADLNMRLLWARDLALSATGIADFRAEVEGWMVTDENSRGREVLGEVVKSPLDSGALVLDERSVESLQGWPVRNVPESAQPKVTRAKIHMREGRPVSWEPVPEEQATSAAVSRSSRSRKDARPAASKKKVRQDGGSH